MRIARRFRKYYRLWPAVETLVLTLLMFVIINSAVQNFTVDGSSMNPVLHNGEIVLANKWSYLFHAPERGDVAVFIAPISPRQTYMKRIIALPGDSISVTNGVPTVNGVTLKEFYVAPRNRGAASSDLPLQKRIVPPDDYFVMGDNRVGSYDSRSWGFLPRNKILGRVMLVYWPFGQNNNGFLPDTSSVFANVHQAQGRATAGSNSHGVDGNEMVLLAIPTLFAVFFKQRRVRGKTHDKILKELQQPLQTSMKGDQHL